MDDKICTFCEFPLSEHIRGEECPDYESICGRWIEAINEYAMTCDDCAELTMRGDLTMDMKTQLSYCDECIKKKVKETQKMKLISCSCSKWYEGMPQIVGAIQVQNLRYGVNLYTGAEFKFCPWCGEVLEEKERDVQETKEEVSETTE